MSEDPLTNPEEIWYTDGTSFVFDGKRRAGYAIVCNFETIEAEPLPPSTSAQLAELIALTQALELGKGKRIAIYTDSKYAFLVLHAHAAIWKEKGHLTTRESPVKYGDQILRLVEAVHLPTEVSVSYYKGHQKGSTEVAKGSQAADEAAPVASVVSDSVRPHRWQPIRLLRPWDSPGKNTGVGCHLLLHFLLHCGSPTKAQQETQS